MVISFSYVLVTAEVVQQPVVKMTRSERGGTGDLAGKHT